MRRKECYFDRNNIEFIDYTNADMLKRYLTNWGRIKSAKDTGVCRFHQRRLGEAVKRARYLAILPYLVK